MISFALESLEFDSHTDILSLFYDFNVAYCVTTDTADENIDL